MLEELTRASGAADKRASLAHVLHTKTHGVGDAVLSTLVFAAAQVRMQFDFKFASKRTGAQ